MEENLWRREITIAALIYTTEDAPGEIEV